MKKILFSILATAFCLASHAQWDGTSAPWTQGNGTQNNPYQISSPQHLAYLSDMVASGLNNYQNTYFVLTSNINLSNQEWTPIGDTLHPFKGNIDGAGHGITGLLVTSSSITHKGLIGYLQYGQIKNLTCTGNLSLSSTIHSGGIIAAKIEYNASILNCHSYGNVLGTYSSSPYMLGRAGGIVGYCRNNVTVRECTNHATVKGYYSGGIVGYWYNENTQMYGIQQCVNYGSVESVHICGGIIGYADKINIVECGNMGNITAGNNSGGDKYIGGIIGNNNNSQWATISLCYNQGDVYASGNFHYNPINLTGLTAYVGGIAGSSSGPAEYCYNSGSVTSSSTAYYGDYSQPHASCHGITNSSCSNSYNSGTLTAYAYMGSSSCFGTGSPATNCYYLSGCGATSGGVAKSEVQMKSSSFPVLLNQDSTVFIMDDSNYNNGFPVMYYLYNCHAFTDGADQVLSASARLNGHHTGSCDSVGFLYRIYGSSDEFTRVMAPTVAGTTSMIVDNLTWDTVYQFCHVAYWRGQTICGDTMTFHTLTPGVITVASNNSEWGTVTGGGTFPIGTAVTLYASATYPYQFSSWQDGNTDNPRIVNVTGNASYTATFAMGHYTLNLQSNNDSWGSVTGGGTYLWNTQTTLTAVPTTGHFFTQWSDGVTENPRVVTVLTDTSIMAIFDVYYYTLTVESDDSLIGSVSGSGVYPYMEPVEVEAVAIPRHHFVMWNDSSTLNPRIINITNDTILRAFFAEDPQCTFLVISDDTSMGTVSGSGTYYVGDMVEISATPTSNHVFLHWSDGNTDGHRTITALEDIVFTAYFSPLQFYVNVYSNDDNLGYVTGGGEYGYGSNATVTANPAQGCQFLHWSNGVEVNPYTFTVYGDVNLIATFERNTGVDDVDAAGIAVTAYNHELHISGAEGQGVSVYDVVGRKVYASAQYDRKPVELPCTGIYLLKIGDKYTKKIVLIK